MLNGFKVTKDNVKEAELMLKLFEYFNSLGRKKQIQTINILKKEISNVKKEVNNG